MDREAARPPWNRLTALCWPLAIALLGLSLRLAYVLDYAAHPLGRLPWVDEGAYWTRAQAMLAGAWLPDRAFYQDPLYPYVLAGLMRVVGTEVSTLRVTLACLGALTPLAVYVAGRLGLGRAEGVVAGLLTAMSGPLVFTDGLLEKEGIAALAAATALALTAWAAEPASRSWRAGASGLAWGIVALLRANALALAVVGGLWWASADAGVVPARQRWARAVLFVLAFALAIAPATVVNAVITRPTALILTTWQGGANFYIGNGPEATGTYAAPPFVEANPAREGDDFASEAARRAGLPLGPAEVSRFWFREGLKRWRDAPSASLRLLAFKVGLLAHDFEIPDNQDIEVVRLVAAPRLSWGVVSFGMLLPLAALGLGRAERTPYWGFVVLSTLTGLGTTALFFVVGRYRIPWYPGLALLAAAGAVDLARRIARGEWWNVAARVILLAVPAAVLAWRPIPDPSPDRWGHAEIELALAYLAEGSLEPAIDALDDARAIGAGPAARIASLLAEGPVHDRVASLVATRLDMARRGGRPPDLEQARWLRQLPETRAESRRLLDTLVAAYPDNALVRRERGAWWLGEPDDPEARGHAEAELHQVSRRFFRDPSAAVLLALMQSDPTKLTKLPAIRRDRMRERVQLARAIATARHRSDPASLKRVIGGTSP